MTKRTSQPALQHPGGQLTKIESKTAAREPALALIEFSSIATGMQGGDAMIKRAPITRIVAGVFTNFTGGSGMPGAGPQTSNSLVCSGFGIEPS